MCFSSLWSDDEVSSDSQERTRLAQDIPGNDVLRDIEDVGPTIQETHEPAVPESLGGSIVHSFHR